MELRQLLIFREVAQTLSFTRAATALNYAQSNITQQIQSLEAELGVPLFERLGRRVLLTEAGARFLTQALKVLQSVDDARATVAGSDTPSGTLVLGASETVCAYRLPAVLHQFQSRHPQVRISFRPLDCANLRESLAQGLIDVAFLLEAPFDQPNVLVQPLVSEQLRLIAAPRHPLAGAAGFSAVDLQNETLLLTPLKCSYRTLFEQALADEGVRPAATMEFANVEAIKQCVMAGIGVALLPEVAVAGELEQGRLVSLPWHRPEFILWTQMAWHKDKWMSPALAAFLQVARQTVCRKLEAADDNFA